MITYYVKLDSFISPAPRVSGTYWRCKMKKSLLALVLMFVPALSQAEVKLKFTMAEAMPVVFQEGEVVRLPLVSVYGLALVFPQGGFAWVGEGAIATPGVQFTPAYRLITGLVIPLNQQWSFGATVMFQHRPEYRDGPPSSNLIGLGIGPGVKIIDGLTLLVIVGGTKVLEDNGPFGVAIQPKLAFDLPL